MSSPDPAASGPPPNPPSGWYPASDGPYDRWWDGNTWSSHTRPHAEAGPIYPATMTATDQTNKSTETVIAWILTVLTGGYLLPWAIAATRGKSNSGTIGLLNLLLGWTVIGWVIALVMACSAHQQTSLTTYR